MMKSNIKQRRQNVATFVLSLLSILFMAMGGCTEPDRPNTLVPPVITTPPPAAPVITTHPYSQTVTVGNSTSFYVSVINPARAILSYQWKRAPKGSTVFTDIAMAWRSSYTTATLSTADNGTQYKVVVSATNLANKTSSTTSSIATITVSEVLSSNQMPKIAWTHIDGTKQYSNAPTDGVLLGTTLTTTVTDIKSVDAIPSSITSIGSVAFWNCSGLTSITIPNSVTNIGQSAFSDCTSLTSIIIPNSVTGIGWSAFSGCGSLASITIPNSVTGIAMNTFYGCSGLTSITIPNSVISIGTSAFYGCSGLTSITIPNSVISIGTSAFAKCTSLASVRVEATVPPDAGAAMFYITASTLSITVPSTSVAAYKAAPGWSEYANQISGY